MGSYLSEWLVCIAMLVVKSMIAVVALYDSIPCSEGGRQRGPKKTLLFNIAYGLTYRVLLTKLVALDRDVCPCFAMSMVATLAWAGEA